MSTSPESSSHDAPRSKLTSKPIISSDSHVSEPEGCYDDIDPKYRDNRPVFVDHEALGPAYVIPDFKMPIPMSMMNAAGRAPDNIMNFELGWDDLEAGGWDPKARLEAQDKDGIYAEVIYPSVGMVLCLHPDVDYRKACFDAYNRWLAGFCELDHESPDRRRPGGAAQRRRRRPGARTDQGHGFQERDDPG